MTIGEFKSFDHTVHLTHEWINELTERLDWDDKRRAYRLLRETLQALRDWLGVNEAANLGAQLPMLLRGVFYDGWHPAGTPVKDRSKEDFFARINQAFEKDPIDRPETAVGAVFEFLNKRVSRGEIDDVRNALPKQIRSLWFKL